MRLLAADKLGLSLMDNFLPMGSLEQVRVVSGPYSDPRLTSCPWARWSRCVSGLGPIYAPVYVNTMLYRTGAFAAMLDLPLWTAWMLHQLLSSRLTDLTVSPPSPGPGRAANHAQHPRVRGTLRLQHEHAGASLHSSYPDHM